MRRSVENHVGGKKAKAEDVMSAALREQRIENATICVDSKGNAFTLSLSLSLSLSLLLLLFFFFSSTLLSLPDAIETQFKHLASICLQDPKTLVGISSATRRVSHKW